MDFCNLHTHSEYSLLDGLGTSGEYCKKAVEIGQSAIAITDHGNNDGAIKFQQEAKTAGIKPIFGAELYIVEDISVKEKGEKRRHITVFVKNNDGWKSLNKLLTISHTDGFYGRPRISPTILLDHIDGLVISSACASSFVAEEWGDKLLRKLIRRIPGDVFLEVMPHKYKDQLVMNNLCIDLSERYGIELIATNDCHYVHAEDEHNHEVLLAMQSKHKWKDKDRWRFDVGGLYLKTAEEMAAAFRDQGCIKYPVFTKAMENTMTIVEKCSSFEIERLEVDLPAVLCKPKGMSDRRFFMQVCEENFKTKIENHPERSKKLVEYRERLDEELGVIINQGFATYFLLVWELISWCKSNDIMVGPGRGSSAGSLICFLLGITAVDPIEHDLLFARFISPARIDLPDIDMDFEDIKRAKIWQHMKDVYGENCVAAVSTFSAMKGRGALRDVSRVFDIPLVDVNAASSCIVQRSGGDFRSDFCIMDAFNTFEDGRKFKSKYPDVTNTAVRMEGQVRGKGQHAAAICISKESLLDGKRGHLFIGGKGDPVLNWDKLDIEHVGLMKLDVLGLNALTILNETRKMVKKNKGIDIDYENMPIDDKKVFDEFSAGHTVGIFQFGSLGLRKVCKETGIDNFKILTDVNALFRPGTLRTGMVGEYQRRKHGEVEWSHKHPFLENITGDTYGIILYQEQVMRFMYDLGGLGWRTADTVRKVMSKSQGVEQFLKFKDLFVAGCKEKKTLDEKTAASLWDELASFGCLTGDTTIYRCSSNQHTGRELNIKDAFEYQSNSNFKNRKLKVLSMHDDGMVKYNTINRIIKTGNKEVFEIKTKGGKKIKASAEHRFLIYGEWKQVRDFVIGDIIAVADLKLAPRTYITTGTGSGAHNHDGSLYTYDEKAQARKLMEKYTSKCQDCGSKNTVEMHHFNGNHRDNSDENTRLLCRKCHHSSKYHDGKIFTRFARGYPAYYDEIVSIESAGIQETYDIEMTDEPRNFMANGFVSHNSYGFNRSHAVVYSLIAYWQMFCKVYHPTEYLCSCLTYGNDDKKDLIVEEAFRYNLDVRPPKAGISKATEWVEKDGVLYAPFIDIKGVGEKLAAQMAKVEVDVEGNGFFSKENKVTPRVMGILQDIGAYDNSPITEDEAVRIGKYFDFSLCRDVSRKFKNILALIGKSIPFEPLSSVDFNTTTKEYTYYFGQMTQIRFGYRGKIDTLEKKLGVSGVSDSLGGVYGNFKDDTDFCMLVFDGGVYKKKKDAVEHSSEDFLIAKASHPNRTTSLLCNDAWFSSDLFGCNLENLGLDLVRRSRVSREDLFCSEGCSDCELHGECKAPVMPSRGFNNIMMIGEAPGKDENEAGAGFVGRSGDVVWDYLRKKRIDRSDLYIDNIVKCYPKDTKTPSKKHIKACSKWIDREIKAIAPVLILAFGNTSLAFFKDQEKGIMDACGTTEWNEEYKAWICWCIHPASVLYHGENKSLFEKGMDNFINKISILGGLKK